MKAKSITGKTRQIGDAVPLIARKVFLTRGVGVHEKQLTARELALTDAGVEKVNLIKASSIIPPGCEIVSLAEGREHLLMGQMAFSILAETSTDEPFKRISAAIGIAKPDDREAYGFFTEVEQDQGFGKTEAKAGEEVRHLAISNLAMSWRAKWNDKMFSPAKETYWIKNKRVRVSSVAQSATGDKDGKHTSVFVAAVFIF